jgi:hypothetical protein
MWFWKVFLMIFFQGGTMNQMISDNLESEIGPITSKTIIAAAGSMNQLITFFNDISQKHHC